MTTTTSPNPAFGVLVMGPPGAGKTALCVALQSVLREVRRPEAVVNLDFANDAVPYECALDVRDLITVEDAMKTHCLGPNGALMYCMEHLEANEEWFVDRLAALEGRYVVMDCPGQVELFTHHPSARTLLQRLQRRLDLRVTAITMIDSTLCIDLNKYLAALMVGLSTQLLMEAPHLNVLAKLDLLEELAPHLNFDLGFFTEASNLQEIVKRMFPANAEAHPFDRKFREFTNEICEVIEDFNLAAFRVSSVKDPQSILAILKLADHANGFKLDNTVNVGQGAGFGSELFDAINESVMSRRGEE